MPDGWHKIDRGLYESLDHWRITNPWRLTTELRHRWLVAIRELGEAAQRADNAALVGDLPDLDVSATDVVADLEAGRAARRSP